MFQAIYKTVDFYIGTWYQMFLDEWHDMTPEKYAALLIGIGVVGFLLMKSSGRK